MRVVGIDLGQHLGVALCDDGKITQAGLLEGPTATQRLCAALAKFASPPGICWEKSLWLPGRKTAFSGVEQQRGAILATLPDADVLEVMPQEPRGALMGNRNAREADILEWAVRQGYGEYMPRHKRDAERVATTRAAHVCDAILLALYGWDRLYSHQAQALREARA